MIGAPMLKGSDRFQYQSVVDRYHLRPAYPQALFETLFSFVDSHSRVLDIGCGPGKLSYPLAERARSVLAVDLSPAMIALAKADPRDDENIEWRVADIHTTQFDDAFDLIVAGASIHWTRLDELLPRLAGVLHGRVFFIEGDEPVNHPWGEAELELMKQVQIEINEVTPRWAIETKFSSRRKTSVVEHEWFHREDRLSVIQTCSTTIDHYINIMHSRQSFALDCMPEIVAEKFHRDMTDLLAPHGDNGLLTYQVATLMEWGEIRRP